MVADERAEPQPPVVDAHAVEGQPVDVDHDPRPRQPVVEERHQALATREHLRLVAMLVEQRQGVLERFGCCVLERVHAVRRPPRQARWRLHRRSAKVKAGTPASGPTTQAHQ